ncbi:MAG: PKD domain-containing protein, partial [Acidobacteriota bacterium]
LRNVSARIWDFRDGETSSELEPVHEFKAAGDHEVRLTIKTPPTESTGPVTETRTITLKKDAGVAVGLLNFIYKDPADPADPTKPTVSLSPWKPINANGPLDSVPIIRMAVYWGGFEPADNQFRDGYTPMPLSPKKSFTLVKQLQEMNELIEKEVTKRVVLTLRSTCSDLDKCWAFDTSVNNFDIQVSHPPKDLQSTYDAKTAYSPSYHDFVKHVVETIIHYGRIANIEGIVVENEMNSSEFFAGSVEQYSRMAATAKKAVQDALDDANLPRDSVPVYCGGHQGGASTWNLINEYFTLAKEDGQSQYKDIALAFYNAAYPWDKYSIRNSKATLEQKCTEQMTTKKPRAKTWTLQAFQSSLYGYDSEAPESPILDGLNFHNYQGSGSIKPLVRDLYRKYTNQSVVSNEMGIFVSMNQSNWHEHLRWEMVKKIASSKFHVDRFIVWYSQNGKDDEKVHLGGMIDVNSFLLKDNVRTFRFLLDMIGQPELSKADLSDGRPDGIRRYDFTYEGKIVRVVWSDGISGYSEPVPESASLYGIFGEPLQATDGKITLSPGAPIYIVWEPQATNEQN